MLADPEFQIVLETAFCDDTCRSGILAHFFGLLAPFYVVWILNVYIVETLFLFLDMMNDKFTSS